MSTMGVMNILTDQYLAAYKLKLKGDTAVALRDIAATELSPHSFTFYTSVAVMSSSKIEGEQLETDSYVKHKMQDVEYLPELLQKPNDLYNAYLFAQRSPLTLDNFLHSHALLTMHLLPEKWRGMYRKSEMLVLQHGTGRIQFEAALAAMVEQEMMRLWQDIEALATQEISADEVLYYAAFVHLAFVNIHPFNDGNGRAARLLEKWFLAMHLGDSAWYIKSEQYYYEHVQEYYGNLNRLGMFYEELDYTKADPFLQMLASAVVG